MSINPAAPNFNFTRFARAIQRVGLTYRTALNVAQSTRRAPAPRQQVKWVEDHAEREQIRHRLPARLRHLVAIIHDNH